MCVPPPQDYLGKLKSHINAADRQDRKLLDAIIEYVSSQDTRW